MLSMVFNQICRRKNEDAIKNFSQHKLLLRHVDDEIEENTLLHHAVANDNLLAVKFLLEHGANVNYYSSGNAPLHMAQSYEVAKQLIEKKADIEAKNQLKLTPLMAAYHGNELKVMHCLIENNADTKQLRSVLKVDSKYETRELLKVARVDRASIQIENLVSDII